MVGLWESRLNGAHCLNLKLIPHVVVPSDADELEERLRNLFVDHVKGLLEGELVNKWLKMKDDKCDEISDVSGRLGSRNSYAVFCELNERKKGLFKEREMIMRRVREFKNAMHCVLKYLDDPQNVAKKESYDANVDVFRFEDCQRIDWSRIQAFIVRECKRLEDGLPIYMYRQDILRRIYGEQVFLIGVYFRIVSYYYYDYYLFIYFFICV